VVNKFFYFFFCLFSRCPRELQSKAGDKPESMGPQSVARGCKPASNFFLFFVFFLLFLLFIFLSQPSRPGRLQCCFFLLLLLGSQLTRSSVVGWYEVFFYYLNYFGKQAASLNQEFEKNVGLIGQGLVKKLN
jgi:hypothetical protein